MDISNEWDDFILLQKPEIFATFTFGNDFFRRKEGERVRTIERASREGASKDAVKSFLYSLSRKTKQHIRMFYGCEDIVSEADAGREHYPELKTQNKRTHLHGLLCFEGDVYSIYHSVSDDYGSSGLEDAYNQLWMKHMTFTYNSYVRDTEKAFQRFSISKLRAGSYSCCKHSEGELVMDICPRHRNICKKGDGECAFRWEDRKYE